jgi:hypothetical protein
MKFLGGVKWNKGRAAAGSIARAGAKIARFIDARTSAKIVAVA